MHPDQDFVSYICSGLRNSFNTLTQSVSLPNRECKNLLSARKIPMDFQELTEKE